MSSNQQSGGRGRGRVPPRRGRGRGRDGDDQEGAPSLKKVRASSSSTQSPERQADRSQPDTARAQDTKNVQQTSSDRSEPDPTRPANYPRRGWETARAHDLKDLQQATRPAAAAALPDLSGSSSSSGPSTTQSQVQTRHNSQRKGHINNAAGGNYMQKNRSSSSTSADSTPRSQAQTGVADSKQRHPCEGKQLSEDLPDLSPKNTSSSSLSARSTPLSADVVTPNNQLREGNSNAGAADSKQGRNTPSPSSSGGSTPRFTQNTQLSYISVLQKGSDPHKLERFSRKLSVFLNNFTEDGGMFPYYKAELQAMKLRSPFRLTLEFKHMIQYDVELAFETWKCGGNFQDWLLPAVQDFLKLQKYASEDEIMTKTCLTLSGFPSSMKKVIDVLKNATYTLELLGGECRACEAKADAKLVIHLFFTTAFARHAKDLSWDGKFGVNDMFLVNNVELHICRPYVAATGASRLRDLQNGGNQLLPYFKGPAGFPAYFDELKQDLKEATITRIKEPWCVEYFSFHMASLPSMTRRNFELALHFISKNIAIELEGTFGMFSSETATNWQADIRKSGCKVFLEVLDFIDPATGSTVNYENNIGGLVKFKRHFLEHVLFGRVFDVNELELFGARKFSKHLPGAVKLLLQRKKMVKCFGAAWSSLKSSYFDGRDTPTKQ